MGNRLSHSAINRYKMCPRSYRLHYVDRIRPTGTGSALIFGAALDEALNVLLTEIDPEKSAEETFEQAFTRTKINGEEIHIPTSESIQYSKGDLDKDLLDEADLVLIEAFIEKSGLSRDSDQLRAKVRDYSSWLCLRHKGLLMIAAYRTKVLPLITKVCEVQQGFELKNDVGDALTGLVDLIAEIEGHGVCILDNKTAGRPYDKDSAKNSEQLALYLHAFEERYPTRMVGYIVLLKNINKNKVKTCKKCGADGTTTSHKTCNNMIDGVRCHGEFDVQMTPEAMVQVIIDEMQEETEAVVLANTDAVNTMINEKQFEKNEKSCENWFGKPCCYYEYCHNKKDMKGLVKV